MQVTLWTEFPTYKQDFIDEMASLVTEIHAETYADPKAVDNLESNIKAMSFWVVVQNSQYHYIGCAAMYLIPGKYLKAEIMFLSVDEEYRREGIGTSIINRVLEQSQKIIGQKKNLYVGVDTPTGAPAYAFYENMNRASKVNTRKDDTASYLISNDMVNS